MDEWDPDEIERDWLDALALVGELLPTTDEVAEMFCRLGESWSWRQNISWSEEARDALRRAGSVPGEDRTQVIKKDPERLAGRGREKP